MRNYPGAFWWTHAQMFFLYCCVFAKGVPKCNAVLRVALHTERDVYVRW